MDWDTLPTNLLDLIGPYSLYDLYLKILAILEESTSGVIQAQERVLMLVRLQKMGSTITSLRTNGGTIIRVKN